MNNSKLAVVLATLGRPDAVADCLASLRSQTRPADTIVLSVTSEADLPPAELRGDVQVVIGDKGLPAQRNRGMEAILSDHDILVFFDDDYVASVNALEGIERFFDAHPEVVGIMGHLIADGIKGPGIERDDAIRLVEQYDAAPAPPARIEKHVYGLYGCNMAYRVSAIGETRFDTNLPLYAWQEDNDFANRLLPQGQLVKTNAFAGVHRGAKSSRTPGTRLGYSQIANPVYLMRKGTLRWQKAYQLMIRNMIANHVKTLKPEPWVDRWGRVKGNWLALAHLVTGKISPEKILDL